MSAIAKLGRVEAMLAGWQATIERAKGEVGTNPIADYAALGFALAARELDAVLNPPPKPVVHGIDETGALTCCPQRAGLVAERDAIVSDRARVTCRGSYAGA